MCEEQRNAVAHGRCNPVEKGAGQIGPPPFARAGILIESPEGIPMVGPDLVTAQDFDRDIGLRRRPFLADRAALAG